MVRLDLDQIKTSIEELDQWDEVIQILKSTQELLRVNDIRVEDYK